MKQTTKRLAATIIAAAIVLLTLSGCGDQSKPGKTFDPYTIKRVDAAHIWKGTIREDDARAFWYEDIAQWGDRRVDDDMGVITYEYLHEDETNWLQHHHVMPRTHTGALLSKVLQHNTGVARLSDVRVLNGRKGTQTVRAGRDIFVPTAAADNLDLHATMTAPKFNRENLEYDLRLVRTVPEAGKPVGIHGVTFVARWVQTSLDFDSDGIPNATDDVDNNSYSYSSDDDDFNVPGYLCPTRFC